MDRFNRIWLVLFVLGGSFLCYRAITTDMGRVYVKTELVNPTDTSFTWEKHSIADPKERANADVHFSLSHTLGIWVAACLTLMIFSFLYGDNVFYRLAESIFIGVSAAYVMVVGFWTAIVQNLLPKLIPPLVRASILPGLDESQGFEWIYLIPLLLSIMMLMRLSPVGSWLARWPLAFFIGATAGFRLVGFLEADFVRQIQSTMIPLVVLHSDRSLDFWNSVKNCTIVFGVLTALVYFFFSVEHTGIVGQTARVGIWVLMITFGASFGYTVMGRIALLIQRLEFLFDDWLWLIDPVGRRLGM